MSLRRCRIGSDTPLEEKRNGMGRVWNALILNDRVNDHAYDSETRWHPDREVCARAKRGVVTGPGSPWQNLSLRLKDSSLELRMGLAGEPCATISHNAPNISVFRHQLCDWLTLPRLPLAVIVYIFCLAVGARITFCAWKVIGLTMSVLYSFI